ncbi:hypothetical protein L2E82_41020 [Cichorium intybus]|uniref:Uncharacterized protein n=1 Tax=Cichorium intybus TaxID=13427 RepID=A0ACB9ANS0_CICIN|nr:hypothetical protein L2E82_41020 [Cichorium intybus]
MEEEHSLDEDWLDVDNDGMGMEEHGEEIEKIQNVETVEDKEPNCSVPMQTRSVESRICNEWRREQSSRKMEETDEEDSRARVSGGIGLNCGSLKDKPISISPKGGKEAAKASGPALVGLGAPSVPDLNNSPKSSGCFPYIENDDEMDETLDLGEEDDLEQAIKDEIEKKRKNRKKVSRKHSCNGSNQGDRLSSSKQRSEGCSSRFEEIEQTFRIGEEIGVRFNGQRDLVEKTISREGAGKNRC